MFVNVDSVYIMIVTQISVSSMSGNNYPVHVCASGVMRLVALICVLIVSTKTGHLVPYYSKYLAEHNTGCSLSLNSSSVVCFVQRAVQMKQVRLFPNMMCGPWPQSIFF